MNSEEDTFDRLRRVEYNVAVAEYLRVCMYLPIDATSGLLSQTADIVLIPLGWTFQSLADESIRRRELQESKISDGYRNDESFFRGIQQWRGMKCLVNPSSEKT